MISGPSKERLIERSPAHKEEQCHCEVHYFSWKYDRGEDWYKQHFVDIEQTGQKYVGEKSPSYIPPDPHRSNSRTNFCVQRIKDDLPKDTKFIFTMRDPADRAYSQWCHNKQHRYNGQWSKYADLSFGDAVRMNDDTDRAGDRLPHGNQLLYYSDYYLQLEQWIQVYGNLDNVYIMVNEEVKLRPHEEYRKLFAWLDLPEEADYGRDFSKKAQGGIPARNYVSSNFINHTDYETFGVMQEEDRAYLDDYYRDSKDKLYNLIGREIKLWEL
tara:strand:+ start:780 stop:1589 length:810 start_codon:yes stop_codon:yes gene_type:complete